MTQGCDEVEVLECSLYVGAYSCGRCVQSSSTTISSAWITSAARGGENVYCCLFKAFIAGVGRRPPTKSRRSRESARCPARQTDSARVQTTSWHGNYSHGDTAAGAYTRRPRMSQFATGRVGVIEQRVSATAGDPIVLQWLAEGVIAVLLSGEPKGFKGEGGLRLNVGAFNLKNLTALVRAWAFSWIATTLTWTAVQHFCRATDQTVELLWLCLSNGFDASLSRWLVALKSSNTKRAFLVCKLQATSMHDYPTYNPPMQFGCVELVEQHGSTRSSRRARHVGRVEMWRDEPSGIWALNNCAQQWRVWPWPWPV